MRNLREIVFVNNKDEAKNYAALKGEHFIPEMYFKDEAQLLGFQLKGYKHKYIFINDQINPVAFDQRIQTDLQWFCAKDTCISFKLLRKIAEDNKTLCTDCYVLSVKYNREKEILKTNYLFFDRKNILYKIIHDERSYKLD